MHLNERHGCAVVQQRIASGSKFLVDLDHEPAHGGRALHPQVALVCACSLCCIGDDGYRCGEQACSIALSSNVCGLHDTLSF